MGPGVGEGKGQGGEIRNLKSSPSPHRMTVMSLVVLILSWGSLGLEAASAVVSAGSRGLCGTGFLGPEGAGGLGSWV